MYFIPTASGIAMSHIFEKLQYYTEPKHTAYSIENLNKINKAFDENNYWTYAFMLQNNDLTEEEKKVYTDMLKMTLEKEKKRETEIQKILSHDNIDGNLCGNENNHIE